MGCKHGRCDISVKIECQECRATLDRHDLGADHNVGDEIQAACEKCGFGRAQVLGSTGICGTCGILVWEK